MTVGSKAFKQVGEFELNEVVYGNFLVKSLKTDKTVGGKTFMDIELGDKTGSLIGKLWDVTYTAEQLVVGDIAYATGKVTEWNGSYQLKIDYVEKAKNGPDISEFVPAAPFTPDELDVMVFSYIQRIEDGEIKDITRYLYNAHKDDFLVAPAAWGMHHAIYSGLAFHVVTMLQSAEKLMDVYTFLNKDLLYAGIILHDLAKVLETEFEHGNVTDYSRPGFLLGHIVQGTMLIEKAAILCETSDRTKEILQHMVVSHHDKPEWGSPVAPKLPEAMMLHFIDNIDAKMYMAKELVEGKMNGEYTEYHKGIRSKLISY